MILREYQQKTIDQIRSALKQGCKRILVTLPTGAGKSIIMGHIAKSCIEKGTKVLALMHRRGLVNQLGDRFESCGVNSGTIMAGIDTNLENPVQVGTIQTFSRRLNFEEIDWDTGEKFRPWEHPADVIMIDEAHRSLSKTYVDILKSSYRDKVVLGFTATPVLSSGAGFCAYYERLIQPVTVQELVDIGSLVPGIYYGLSAPDLAGIKMVAGDYEKKTLGQRVKNQKIIGDIVVNWCRIAQGKKTLVFAVNVKHSKAIVYEFNKNGITAEHLDAHSDDDERAEVIKKFRTGEIQVLSNVGLFVEGTDIPEIECICLARPTKSIGVYLQMVGRGARPCPGKKNFIVLDHGKNVNEHGFYEDPIVWSLEGKKISYHRPALREKKEKHKLSCKICNAIFTGRKCPICHTEVENYGQKIEAIEAELKQLNEAKIDTSENKKSAAIRRLQPSILVGMLKHEASRLGKNDKWIRANYKNIMNRWPKNINVRPIPATDVVRNYLKYLRIKWAKSMKGKVA